MGVEKHDIMNLNVLTNLLPNYIFYIIDFISMKTLT